MQAAIQEAQAQQLAFSWLSTGLVCQHWSAAYVALRSHPLLGVISG